MADTANTTTQTSTQDTGTPQAPTTDAGTQTGADTTQTQTTPTTTETQREKVDIGSLPEAVQKEIRDARAEAAKYRTEAKAAADAAAAQQAQIAAINKALGLTTDEPDPKALEATLAERDAQLRTLKVENAFTQSAVKLGADAELTLAVLARNGTLSKMNPDDANFTAELDAAVKAAIDANPKLRAGQVPTTSGSQGFTGESTSRSSAPVDLRQAIANAIK